MRKVKFVSFICASALLFGTMRPHVVAAQAAPPEEREKIESLIRQVGALKDAKFIRNGSTHDPSTAVRFLRGKWNAKLTEVKTARDFIDKVASVSGTSGKAYIIRFSDGREIPTRDFLLAALKKMPA